MDMSNHATGTSSKTSLKRKQEDANNDLNFNSLIHFMKHPMGFKRFSDSVRKYPTDPAPKFFVSSLQSVIEDNPDQRDPLEIVQAWDKWNQIKPLILDSQKSLTLEQRRAKDALDQKFVSYLSVLRCTGTLRIPVRVFCHLACRNGCPPEFKGYNSRTFRESNMQDLELKLDGKHPSQNWNNVLNGSMHLMLRWSDVTLKELVAPRLDSREWEQMNPKVVGGLIQSWFEGLDDEHLESRAELEESLIPTAGTHPIAP